MRLIACVLLIIAVIQATKACEPGQLRDVGHKTCFCLGAVLGWRCVSPESPLTAYRSNNEQGVEPIMEPLDSCIPGQRFMSSCNNCLCGDDGKISNSICTMMACATDARIINETSSSSEEINESNSTRNRRDINGNKIICEPGTLFKYYCNECHCLNDGLVSSALCTEHICNYDKWNEDGTEKYPEENDPEEQNQNYDHEESEDDSNGHLYISYPLRASSIESMEAAEGRCHSGTVFKKFCNFCVCGSDQTVDGSSCTNLVCGLGDENKDVALQTHEFTVETLVEVPEEDRCHTGAIFRKFCNYCFCGTDRSIAGAPCTNMKCDLEIWNEDGTKKM